MMKAVYINEFVDAAKIIVGTLPKPKLKPHHILIKTIATTVNQVDLFVRQGLYAIDVPMPFLLGRDVVGVVVDAHLDYRHPEYNVTFDLLIDTSGQNKLSDNLKLLAENGKLLMITTPKDSTFDAWDFYTNGKAILSFVLSKQKLEQLEHTALFINKHFALGRFLDDAIEVLGYEQIKMYHALIEQKEPLQKRAVFTFREVF